MFFIPPITEAMAIEHSRKLDEAKEKARQLAEQPSVKQSNCQNCGAPHEHDASTCSYCLSPVN